jgi:ABC-type uncharacterized transport system substrate-binding protein
MKALKEVEAGGLVSYGIESKALFRRAAIYVNNIVKGAKPADLPAEQPTSFELAINLKPRSKSARQSRRACWREQIGWLDKV